MSFKECIAEGVTDGSFSENQAKEITDLFDSLEAEYQGKMSAGAAMSQAAKDTLESIKYEKLLKKKQKLQQIQAIKKLLVDEKKYRNALGINDEFDFLEAVYTRDNYSNISSLEQRIDATTNLYLS